MSRVRPPPLDAPDQAGLLLSQVGQGIARSFHACLQPLDLEPRQYLLLRTVGACRDQSQQAVGAALQIPPSRMVVLVDSLSERGLIERVPNPIDRRAHALRLTPAGRRLLQRATPVAAAFEAEVCRPLSAPERATLLALLRRIASARGLTLAPASATAALGRTSTPPGPTVTATPRGPAVSP
jgi:DNA-binding MarR family transcriptional regulator